MVKTTTIVVALAALLVSASARAAWRPTGPGAGSAAARTMTAGNKPAVSASRRNVQLTWGASLWAQGGTIAGYVVRRYNAVTGASTAAASGCGGVVTAFTCADNNVPAGTWQYTVTPAVGNWRGAESPKSAIVTTA